MDLHQTVQASISVLPWTHKQSKHPVQCFMIHVSLCKHPSNVAWFHIGLSRHPFWCCVDSHWTVQESILVLCGFTLDCASIHYSVVWIHVGLCKHPFWCADSCWTVTSIYYSVVTCMNSCWTVQEPIPVLCGFTFDIRLIKFPF